MNKKKFISIYWFYFSGLQKTIDWFHLSATLINIKLYWNIILFFEIVDFIPWLNQFYYIRLLCNVSYSFHISHLIFFYRFRLCIVFISNIVYHSVKESQVHLIVQINFEFFFSKILHIWSILRTFVIEFFFYVQCNIYAGYYKFLSE